MGAVQSDLHKWETNLKPLASVVDDLISRQAAIDALDKIFPADPMRNDYTQGIACGAALATEFIEQLPSAQPDSCKGCKHMGLWENEVENGYPSPCTRCKRRASDNYER